MQVGSLALLSGLSIRRCHELWCRPQMQLGSPVAVALALHMLRGVALEKKKKKKSRWMTYREKSWYWKQQFRIIMMKEGHYQKGD